MSNVTHSQMLYEAPICHKVTENQTMLKMLIRLQRLMCLRVCSAYITVSLNGAPLIAGLVPIGLKEELKKQSETAMVIHSQNQEVDRK